MPHLISSLALCSLWLSSLVRAVADPELTGTWSTKSNKVFTGPGFYDPVKEKMFEPPLTGISYSFTDDGFYEEALYRAVPNPTLPQCPKGIMQFQHGTYTKDQNGSLILTPIDVDGRQLESNPCKHSNSILTRYHQPELFLRYEVYTDPYHNIMRLNLYQFDGSPVNPMYLAYKPPQMLPTVTMNPTAAATGAGAQASPTGNVKRSMGEAPLPMNRDAIRKRNVLMNPDQWWWVGVMMTALGGVGYIYF